MFQHKPHWISARQQIGNQVWHARRGLALMVAALIFGLTPLAAYAATIDVDGTICTLPNAISAANTDAAVGGCTAGSGDDILRLGGLTHSLATGPFNHDGLTATPSVTTTIIISGGVGGAIVQRTGATPYRLFHVGDTGDLTVQSVTVRYGLTDNNNDGGAFYNRNRLTLIDSHVFSNTASGSGDGGGIENHNSAMLTVLNSTIVSNTAGEYGGAIENDGNNTLIVTNTLIFANTAVEDGGAIENYSSTVSLTDSQIIANTSGDKGGGIDNYDNSNATLNNTALISNTAVEGGGIYSYGNSTATLIGSEIRANHANSKGGGIHNTDTSTATVTSTIIASNSADGDGGGIYSVISSTVVLTGAEVISNRAGDDGGGLANDNRSIALLTDTMLKANHAVDGGGAIQNNNSTLILTATQLISNSSDYVGGGLDNYNGSNATLNNSTILSNTASYGGGINNYISHVHIIDSQIRANTATSDGGGIDSAIGVITVTNSTLDDNHAAGVGGGIDTYENSAVIFNNTIISGNSAGIDGGGIYNALTSTVTLNGAQIRANSAISTGGGIYNGSAITATASKLIGNSAVVTGSAVYQSAGQTRINQSCIVNNTDTAVVHAGGSNIDAANNWWGSPDGPGPIGPGSGDSISPNVTFSPFLTSTILGCSARVVDLALGARVSPSGNLGAGQPVTYTLTITNNGARAVNNIFVSYPVPAAVNVSQVITAPGTGFNGSSYVISTLGAAEAVSIVIVGKVSGQLNQNVTLNNVATLDHALSEPVTQTTSSNVVLSNLLWGDYFFIDPANNFAQGETLVHIEVYMITPTVYATVTAQIVFTGTYPPFANAATVAAVQQVTFPPGSTSQEVILTVPSTGGRPRAVELTLQSPVGAIVGEQGTLEISLTRKSYFPSLHR